MNEKADVGRAYKREVRAEVYYCKKYEVMEHLRRCNKKEWMIEGQPDPVRYLQHLLGKIQFILQISPEDVQFREAREDIRRLLRDI